LPRGAGRSQSLRLARGKCDSVAPAGTGWGDAHSHDLAGAAGRCGEAHRLRRPSSALLPSPQGGASHLAHKEGASRWQWNFAHSRTVSADGETCNRTALIVVRLRRIRRPRRMKMFERFTDRARRVVVLAQEEAKLLKHNYIGTEHILLGLIHGGEGQAAKALEGMDIIHEQVRDQVQEIIGQGQQAPSGHIPFTPRAKKVLELSLREALQLGHSYIGTEHILLGLIREGEGVAAQVLVKLGADLGRVRQEVIKLLSGYQGKEPGWAGGREEGPPSGSLVLDQFGTNLTAEAREAKLDPVIGRHEQMQRVM